MSTTAYLARQPIVDAGLQLLGYELLFRHSAEADSAQIDSDLDAGIQVLANTLFDMGTHWLLEGKLAFINMGGEMLLNATTGLLPPDKVVIELTQAVKPNPEIMAQVAELKSQGFRFSMDNYQPGTPRDQFLPLVRFVKVDTLDSGEEKLADTLAVLRGHDVKLIAERVEDQVVFRQCKNLGFDYFQGYFFARPETLSARTINPSQITVLQLMDKVRDEMEVAEIERLFKKDVALTFKLLRYINSAGFGLSCEVQSIRHAISILGLKPLYRWLTLLLATSGDGPTLPALSRHAIIRGRLCELLGSHILSRADRDNLFITGVFSMLDALMETPMETILERLVIPETISDALLTRSGIYGPVLALAEACEAPDDPRFEMLSESLMLTPDRVNQAHLDAIAWAEQIDLD